MKKLMEMVDTVLISVWGTLWVISLSALTIGVAIWSVRWVLSLMGVL